MKIFAQRLKEIRTERNLTQTALAELINVDQRTISNWELSLREPDFETLNKIADVLNVSIDYLFGRTD